MTVNQLLNFADEHAHDNGFFLIEAALYGERTEALQILESDPDNKKMKKQLNDAIEKLRIIDLMKVQRLELFRQSSLKET
jgi:hypothetical protein